MHLYVFVSVDVVCGSVYVRGLCVDVCMCVCLYLDINISFAY